jgi:hypothetical protein
MIDQLRQLKAELVQEARANRNWSEDNRWAQSHRHADDQELTAKVLERIVKRLDKIMEGKDGMASQ